MIIDPAMSDWTIYHDPQCSKSCNALEALREKGVEPRVIEYRKDVPSEQEFEMLLMKLDKPATALLRRNEPLFKRKFEGFSFHEHEWVRVMREHPELIERPIVVKGHKAVIARPIDNINDLL